MESKWDRNMGCVLRPISSVLQSNSLYLQCDYSSDYIPVARSTTPSAGSLSFPLVPKMSQSLSPEITGSQYLCGCLSRMLQRRNKRNQRLPLVFITANITSIVFAIAFFVLKQPQPALFLSVITLGVYITLFVIFSAVQRATIQQVGHNYAYNFTSDICIFCNVFPIYVFTIITCTICIFLGFTLTLVYGIVHVDSYTHQRFHKAPQRAGDTS